ncbi:Putative beta-barrel porin-2, OmpL-like. bbp2 [bacterium A37T11]|nr:Putative beta-barrel porin-2, OmpL-like. bbp2 [bacterium A37T11]
MKKALSYVVTAMLCAPAMMANAQEENEALTISGSADAYYKYDFSKKPNIPTSFASDQNSVSIGMVDLILGKKVGKASFVGDLSFGPRGQGQSLLSASDGNSFHIQNLYMSYAFTDKFSMTAGFMGTFIGYEIISPTGNFNYSTSYLFSAGPFQNAGIKANYQFTPKVGLMVGLFNDWNKYTDDNNGVTDIGAQLSLAPVEGWNAYLNFLKGPYSGTIYDLTTSYQVTTAFKVGINAADYSVGDDQGGYDGGALYLQYGFTDAFALGLRGEYFKTKDIKEADVVTTAGTKVAAFTLSANIKAGPLTVIPEFRYDRNSAESFEPYWVTTPFINSDMNPTKGASQFALALVYAF